ncbi:MAG: Golgi phosphoprotein 3 [Glaciecola sp.]|jgi:Golgi phosphoprotein 3
MDRGQMRRLTPLLMIESTMQLFLYEEVMLLALRNDKGTVTTCFSEHAVAGAVLAELLLTEHIKISSDKKGLVDVVQRKPLGDPIIDEALHSMATAKRRASLKDWLSRLARMKKLRHRVAERLCTRGILRATEDTILLIFKRKIYPELDPRPEQAIIKRLDAVIFGNQRDVDARTTVLISLAHGTELLQANFGRKESKAQKKRIEAIIEGEAIGKATKEVIQAVHAAIMVATIVPVIVTS